MPLMSQLLRKHGGLHPKSSALRLYGCQFVSIRATIQDETQSICAYARKIAPEEELLQEYLRVQKTECDAELEEELSQLAKPFLECTING